MTSHSTRSWVKAAALALCGIAMIVTAGCGTPASAASVRQSPASASAGQQAAGTTAVPVVVVCINKTQVRPSLYILACADGQAHLSHLSWAAWGSSSALASGTYTFNDCVPSCVGGQGRSFGVLAVLWDAQPWPGHPGVRYFTRLTIIVTGNRSYTAGGKAYQLPQTLTEPLLPIGG